MCKIFTITNMEKIKVNKKLLTTIKDEVCALSDKDGFGYAILDDNGGLYGERTTRPSTFSPLTAESRVLSLLDFVTVSKNNFGKKTIAKPKSLIAHGRFSTNTKSLQNTHPFVDDNLALIHNGVVSHEDHKFKLKTDCDTELLLHNWNMGGVAEIEKNINGYYALSILDRSTGLLHVLRDDRASLYCTYSSTVNSFLIATTESILINIAKTMKWSIETPELIHDNTYIVFDRNTLIEKTDITPNKTVEVSEKLSRLALGEKPYVSTYGDEYPESVPFAEVYESDQFLYKSRYEEQDEDREVYEAIMQKMAK